MIIEQIQAALGGKFTIPAGGAANQRLCTDGNGGVYWDGSSEPITAQQLNIGGKVYVVRTGTAGAEGYLTIGQNTIWLGLTPVKPYIGNKEVTDIYLAAQLVYTIGTGEFDVYNNAYQHGITWQVNKLPRPQYTAYASASLSYANITDGYLWLYFNVHPSGTTYNHNAHVMTENPVVVPSRATQMHVRMRGTQNGLYCNIRFGMLPANAPTSYSTTNGGILSPDISMIGTNWQEKTLELPDEIIGTNNLHPIVNISGVPPEGSTYGVRVQRIWFT